MPVRPENRARYPKNWTEISLAIRNGRAANRCECLGECGLDHAGRCNCLNRQANPRTGSEVVLTVAHLDHNPECADPERLRAFCQQCHNRYDGPHRAETRAATRRRAIEDAGQLAIDTTEET